MNCPNCQTEIVTGVKFCSACGQRIDTFIEREGDVRPGDMPTQVNIAKPDVSRGQWIGERYGILGKAALVVAVFIVLVIICWGFYMLAQRYAHQAVAAASKENPFVNSLGMKF